MDTNRRFHTILMYLWKYVSEYFTFDLKRDFKCKIWNLFEMQQLHTLWEVIRCVYVASQYKMPYSYKIHVRHDIYDWFK